MIKSPCKGCLNERAPKDRCMKKCRAIHDVQIYSSCTADELCTVREEIFETRILLAENLA